MPATRDLAVCPAVPWPSGVRSRCPHRQRAVSLADHDRAPDTRRPGPSGRERERDPLRPAATQASGTAGLPGARLAPPVSPPRFPAGDVLAGARRGACPGRAATLAVLPAHRPGARCDRGARRGRARLSQQRCSGAMPPRSPTRSPHRIGLGHWSSIGATCWTGSISPAHPDFRTGSTASVSGYGTGRRPRPGSWRMRREQTGDGGKAGSWARRAFELTPDDEDTLRRLLQLLDRTGDRAGGASSLRGVLPAAHPGVRSRACRRDPRAGGGDSHPYSACRRRPADGPVEPGASLGRLTGAGGLSLCLPGIRSPRVSRRGDGASPHHDPGQRGGVPGGGSPRAARRCW